MSQFSDFITPSIYSYNADDGTSEGFENSPRIMYNNGVKTLTSCTYYVPAQNGVAGDAFELGLTSRPLLHLHVWVLSLGTNSALF